MESLQTQRKRLSMRSWRRGTKEMDLVLGPYSDIWLAQMDADELQIYDRLLDQHDQDLIQWVLGQAAPEPEFHPLMEKIREFAISRLAR